MEPAKMIKVAHHWNYRKRMLGEKLLKLTTNRCSALQFEKINFGKQFAKNELLKTKRQKSFLECEICIHGFEKVIF